MAMQTMRARRSNAVPGLGALAPRQCCVQIHAGTESCYKLCTDDIAAIGRHAIPLALDLGANTEASSVTEYDDISDSSLQEI